MNSISYTQQAGFLACGSCYLPPLPGLSGPVGLRGVRPRLQQWLACDGIAPSFLLSSPGDAPADGEPRTRRARANL